MTSFAKSHEIDPAERRPITLTTDPGIPVDNAATTFDTGISTLATKRAVSRHLSSLRHEMNGLLSCAKVFTSILLRDGHTNLDRSQIKYLSNMNNVIDSLAKLVDVVAIPSDLSVPFGQSQASAEAGRPSSKPLYNPEATSVHANNAKRGIRQ